MNSSRRVLDEKLGIRITEVDGVKCFAGDKDRRGGGVGAGGIKEFEEGQVEL